MISSDSRRAHWATIVAEQEASGLPASRWCRDNKIETNNFYNWRKRLNGSSSAASTKPAVGQWLPLGAAEQNSHSAGLTLRVGRVSIDVTPGFDRYLLAEVLSVFDAR